eukprot:CCRYP_010393-RA/>CCRYP_010393-RA protein AED:0.07 eAED:0.07 QI:58/0.6/0.66/1/1/1/6/1554/1100
MTPPISVLLTPNTPTTLCIGSGRFLRSVLVPFLSSNSKPAVFQTRGRSFLDFFVSQNEAVAHEHGAVVPSLRYPVDTIAYDGTICTDYIEISGVGTLGSSDGKSRLLDLLRNNIRVIGVGVTEAGLSHAANQCMRDLTLILHTMYCNQGNNEDEHKICIINTDNVLNNGDVIRCHVLENAREFYTDKDEGNGRTQSFVDFLEKKVAFLNTMVDRITSSREGSNGMIPSCEPLPEKAMVICDPGRDLPDWMREEEIQKKYGVKIRQHSKELECDISLKLRVANGTHTALAHAMASSSFPNTESLSSPSSSLFLSYLDSLYQTQILPGALHDGISEQETESTWHDWRKRMQHPYFGLSTFFITQNGAAKGGIRLGPTLKSLVNGAVGDDGVSLCLIPLVKPSRTQTENPISVSMAFAFAAILRFLSPIIKQSEEARQRGIYVGWLDGHEGGIGVVDMENAANEIVTYADGLRYNLSVQWYEFKCTCSVEWNSSSSFAKREVPLPEAFSMLGRGRQPSAYKDVIRSYLLHPQGGDLRTILQGESAHEEAQRNVILETFVCAISTLYARMASGDSSLQILKEMQERQHVYSNGFSTSCDVLVDGTLTGGNVADRPMHFCKCPIPDSSCLMTTPMGLTVDDVPSVVISEVRGQRVIDLHTHLLPASHGALCLWGIDELLTYHYLVAEYFMTAPADISPVGFYAMNKTQQADLIWEALFVNRSPISEATRGVVTTLQALGLEAHVKSRDLPAIRRFYEKYRRDGLSGTERFVDMTYRISGVRYAIMTNIPFDSTESQHWRPKKKASKEYPDTFKSALRVDPLLAGDRNTIETALKASGYGTTIADARRYLHDWCDTMKPEYLMASTPHDFYLPPTDGGSILAGVKKLGVNEAALQTPFAFTDLSRTECNRCDGADDIPSIINENSDFLVEVLMPVCEERNLPLALKIGAHRSVNPSLLAAGDGMVAFADTGSLARLCGRFPKVRFLATFLSRANQHEACVLASKFRNLHIYGCWWYCNNPSIIEEITRMRVEMLGTAFTAQHSDARVVDQLIYKWSHSRAVIANVLSQEYAKIARSGWKFSRDDIRRDVWRLFGGSYEEFMSKTLK